MNILLFSASLRQHSYNQLLVDYLAKYLGTECVTDTLLPGQFALPLFNQDLESNTEIITQVAQIYTRFRNADGFIVASPEYNGHVSPYLKNTLDWVSRMQRINGQKFPANPFLNKPLLLASASTGWTGGLLGLQDARSVFGYLGCLVMQGQVCVSDAGSVFSGGSVNFDPAYATYVKNMVEQFQSLVSRNKQA